ncbi:hypothetical protein OG349_06285 [Streptomyces sp. NBC_01317]|uniref:hypothetical protein n=1 Tax=Streptomyces sp. NBC_01317 TaxID=2903822 RepID=UPI002E0FC398|nr:hypothetical protein OG349_06285 [Streptomyces sp. NBC_01317]
MKNWEGDTPELGKTYLLQSVNSGMFADLESLSFTTENIVQGTDPCAASAHWTVVEPYGHYADPDDHSMRNEYSGLYFMLNEAPAIGWRVMQGHRDWGYRNNVKYQKAADGTYSIRGGSKYVSTADDTPGSVLMQVTDFDPDDAKMKWWFIDIGHAQIWASNVTVEVAAVPGQQQRDYFKAEVILRNPAQGEPLTDWALSFHLSKGLGGTVSVAEGDGVELVLAQPDSRGLAIAVQAADWSHKKTIQPSDSFTFTLSGGAEHATEDISTLPIRADDCRVNGVPVRTTVPTGQDG